MSISEQVIKSMYKHLTQSYSADEARDILVQKYPEAEGDIEVFLDAVQSEVPEVSEPVTDTVKIKKAVSKQKPAKEPKQTKMTLARQLYIAAADKSRSAMIEVFGKELGLSKAAASTYYYTVKK